jgi:hypothetical protein
MRASGQADAAAVDAEPVNKQDVRKRARQETGRQCFVGSRPLRPLFFNSLSVFRSTVSHDVQPGIRNK